MTNRFFAGLHPNFGAHGIWLSKPGIDVLSTGPATNFLLRPDFKNEQIVMSGTAYIPRSNPFVNILYPTTFTKRPYVWFKDYISSEVVEYPHNLGMFGTPGYKEVQVSLGIGLDRIGLNNGSDAWDLFIDFVIYHRSVGS